MPWLLRDGEVLAALEIAATRGARRRGLLGRDEIEGAMLLKPARSVHTVGMRFPIDVAFCDRELAVVAVRFMKPRRMSRPRLKGMCVIEASEGAFDRWGLHVGDRLEVRE